MRPYRPAPVLAGIAVAALSLGSVVGAGSEATARVNGHSQVTIHKIGKPSWRPVDFNVFSGTIGTADNGYADYGDTIGSVLPPPNHAPHPDLGVGPGAPHDPPYRDELSEGIENAGYAVSRCFTPDEFSDGEAVIAAWMVVPRGRRHVGRSPDFASGPIISNLLFPIHVQGVAYRNGEVFDPTLVTFDVPALDDQLEPPFDVDGHSHFPFFIADNQDFGPEDVELTGRYLYDMTMVDATGHGWSIEVSFVVRQRC